MTVIELGDVSPTAGDEPPPRPEFHPRSVRRLVTVGVALLCALVLGASARPGTPTVHQVWSVPISSGDSVTARTDGLYLHRFQDGRPQITAYETATGAVRWTRRTEGNVSWMYQGEPAGALLLSGDEKFEDVEFDDGSLGQIAYGGSTTALDAATGRWRWRVPGEVQFVTGDTVLLADRDRTGDFERLRLVGARDGAEIWTRALPRQRHLSVQSEDGAPPRIVVADRAGNATALRHSDGAVLAEQDLAWSRAELEHGIDTYLYIVGDLVIVHRNDPASGSITAYRADTLERLWARDTQPYPTTQSCGPVICLSETGRMLGLDPGTGVVRWTVAAGTGAQPISPDRLLISADSGDPPEQFLIDPATGERIGSPVRGWSLEVRPAAGPRFDATGTPVGPAARRIVVLSRFFTPGALRTAVRHLDVATGRVVLVGEVTTTEQVGGDQCDSVLGYLACRRDDELVVTEVG